MKIDKVAVIGTGTMGHGIIQTVLAAGKSAVGIDVDDAMREKAESFTARAIRKLGKRGELTDEQVEKALASVEWSAELSAAKDADLVIEAVSEKLDLKAKIFTALNEICGPDTIFATNTSSLSVTEIGQASGRPARMCGLHFFNPVPSMALVEVIKTDHTDEEVYESAFEFAGEIGKTPVRCGDTPGFIVNRLLIPFLLSAIIALEEGVATREDIDTAMKLGAGHPMGPLKLCDLVGLDVAINAAKSMLDRLGDGVPDTPDMLQGLVDDGKLGRKTRAGFYDY